jgi:hypothetical protein
MRRLALALVLLAGCGGDGLVLPDLDGRPVRPEAATAVFVFLQPGCPVSDRSAPEVLRLREAFPAAAFWIVYPGDRFPVERLRAHRDAFLPGMPALRDPSLRLARACRIAVTPEAAVLTAAGGLAYRGRIDDLHADLHVRRPAAARRDLEDALRALARGDQAPSPSGPSVGCPVVP